MTWVYILRCSDDSFYVGHTDDLPDRERTHNEGRGARYTAARRPVRLVYSERFESSDCATARERQLKRWSAGKKNALVAGDFALLKQLSRRRRR
jgi:predicted GIY-YIG superfamily endonuclease